MEKLHRTHVPIVTHDALEIGRFLTGAIHNLRNKDVIVKTWSWLDTAHHLA